jgi:5,10-methenyltetrahydrofolate synthetase
VALARGVYDIPYPDEGPEVRPATVLLPMNGFDAGGYRLGYGGGYFDRTLAALDDRPRVIGVTYELARLPTIHPQPWDIPMDYVVTEAGVYTRRNGHLEGPVDSEP